MRMQVKLALLLLLTAAASAAAANVEVYSGSEIQGMGRKLAQQQTRFASQDLARYGTYYNLLAVRKATGSSEVHEHEADIFIVESGRATLVTGGEMVHPRTIKAGEIRGSSISGGERREISPGDIVEIPPGT